MSAAAWRKRRGVWAGLAILLSVLLLVSVDAAKTSKKKRSKEDASLFPRFLRRMVESDDRVVSLDDDDFHDLIVGPGAGRAFPVFVTFTAGAARFGCGTCQMHVQAVSQAAQSYLQQRRPTVEEQPFIMAVVDIDNAPGAFGKMKMETVPHSFIFKAGKSPPLPPPVVGFDVSDLNTLLDAIKREAGVHILPLPDARLTSIIGVLFAVLVALGAYLAIEHTEWLTSVPRNRQLWLVVSLCVYGFGVGGMVYCIIRSPPPYIYNRERQVQLFAMHTSQDQYVLEGVVVAALNVLTGLSCALTIVLASSKRYTIVQYIGTTVSLALSLYMLQRYVLFYESKVRWYRINETFHQPVSDFLFGSIKKSTGPLPRLLRLSQLWLWDYKDWPSYQKHLHAYLVKYGKREYAAVLKKLGMAAAGAASKKAA